MASEPTAAQRSRQELEDYADSLFGQLEAEKHVHRKDNEYLLVQNDRMRGALSSILTTIEDASVPYERLKIGALARAGLERATPSGGVDPDLFGAVCYERDVLLAENERLRKVLRVYEPPQEY